MKPAFTAIAIGALLCLSVPQVAAQSSKDWADIKGSKELRALFSDKTHRGKSPDGTPYVAHFSSDGRGLLVWVGQQYPRTWEVKGKEVCITAATGPASGTTCRTYHRSKKNRNEIVARTREGWINQFTVEDGIPQF